MTALHRTTAATAIGLALAFAAAPSDAETIKMTAVAAAPPVTTTVKAVKEGFIPEVNKRLAASGKDFKIEWTEAYSQTLAKFTEVFETVDENIAQLGIVLKNFEESKLPLEQVYYMVPFSEHTPQQLMDIDVKMRAKLPEMNAAYEKHNQVFLISGITQTMQLFTTFPVKTVDDLKGHKIGASGAMGHYLRGTGAVVVNASMANSYTDIRNGLYDGYPINEALAFPYRTYQAAKYMTRVNFGVNATSALTVNKSVWAKLPEHAQKIFRDVAKQWPVLQNEIDTAKLKFIVGKMKANGVEMQDFAPEARKRWAHVMPNIALEWADNLEKRGLPGKKVLTAYLDELRARHIETYRDWGKP
jgi:TRAP-type transport system periplasmic protein